MRAVNLIPSDQRSNGNVATRSGGAAYFVLVLIGGVALLAGLYGSASHGVSNRRTEVAALNAQTQEVQAQVARLSPYTSFIALREQRVQAVAQLVGSRFDWPAAMGELSRVLPSNVALTSVSGTIATGPPGSTSAPAAAGATGASAAAGKSSGGAVSSATPPGATPGFTVVGCATSQSAVAQVLVRLRLIAGVKSVELQSSTKPTGGSGGASGTSTGGCAGGDPVFTALVDFEPLPSAPALLETPQTTAAKGASR